METRNAVAPTEGAAALSSCCCSSLISEGRGKRVARPLDAPAATACCCDKLGEELVTKASAPFTHAITAQAAAAAVDIRDIDDIIGAHV